MSFPLLRIEAGSYFSLARDNGPKLRSPNGRPMVAQWSLESAGSMTLQRDSLWSNELRLGLNAPKDVVFCVDESPYLQVLADLRLNQETGITVLVGVGGIEIHKFL